MGYILAFIFVAFIGFILVYILVWGLYILSLKMVQLQDMNTHKRKILNNTIRYIASTFKKESGKNLTQQKLYKLIALYDFQHLKEAGFPALGISYLAMEQGPVPNEIYGEANKCESTEEYMFKKGWKENVREVIPKGAVDLKYLSTFQKKLIDRWIEILIESSTDVFSELTHNEIKSWNKAWSNKEDGKNSAKMDYIDEFEEGEVPEEYLIYREAQ